jgi:hypothetical protein
MGTINQSITQGEVLCVLPPAIYGDPLVRLAIELRAVYAGWGAASIAPSMRGLSLALRLAAVRLELPGLPDWWAAVPETRDTDMIVYLADGESPGEQFFETFPPFGPLRGLIEDAAAALAEKEAAL